MRFGVNTYAFLAVWVSCSFSVSSVFASREAKRSILDETPFEYKYTPKTESDRANRRSDLRQAKDGVNISARREVFAKHANKTPDEVSPAWKIRSQVPLDHSTAKDPFANALETISRLSKPSNNELIILDQKRIGDGPYYALALKTEENALSLVKLYRHRKRFTKKLEKSGDLIRQHYFYNVNWRSNVISEVAFRLDATPEGENRQSLYIADVLIATTNELQKSDLNPKAYQLKGLSLFNKLVSARGHTVISGGQSILKLGRRLLPGDSADKKDK